MSNLEDRKKADWTAFKVEVYKIVGRFIEEEYENFNEDAGFLIDSYIDFCEEVYGIDREETKAKAMKYFCDFFDLVIKG